MSNCRPLPRLIGFAALAGITLLTQAGVASASVATDIALGKGGERVLADAPGNHIEKLAEKYGVETGPSAAAMTVAKSCVGNSAFASKSFSVNGTQVSSLRGNVDSGDTIKVSFEVADHCDDVKIGLAAYKAPAAAWDPRTADQQQLTDHEVGTFDSDGKTHDLEVTAPECFYQVDLFTGEVLTKLTATENYSNPDRRLVDADNGGEKSCDVPPPPPVEREECPADAAARLSKVSYTINGVPGFATLTGNVTTGDIVKVDFTIAENCEDEVLSLVSYDAPTGEFTRATADQQVLFDSETGSFDAGAHSMDVVAPDCYFQVDFVKGEVIEKLGPVDSDNFYGDRLISAGNGGEECIVTEPPSDEVLQTVIERTTPAVESAVEADAVLAETGVDSSQLALLGSGLTLMGAALERAANRIRRNS